VYNSALSASRILAHYQAAQAAATVTLVVTPTAAGQLTNSAQVHGNESDPVGANNTLTQVSTAQAPAADLALSGTLAPDPVQIGSPLTYSLRVQNLGPSSASGVTLTDTLPAGATFVSATASQGSCSQAAGTVSCSFGALGYAAQILADQPLGYWRLDETSGTVAADASGNGHDGTISAGVSLAQSPLVGGGTSMRFPGSGPIVRVANFGQLVQNGAAGQTLDSGPTPIPPTASGSPSALHPQAPMRSSAMATAPDTGAPSARAGWRACPHAPAECTTSSSPVSRGWAGSCTSTERCSRAPPTRAPSA
jgi:uncharacterized repeat protein (TIGR01451 family)